MKKQPHIRIAKGRAATAAFLALALGGAVYLNWSYARQNPQVIAEDTAVETSAAVTDPLQAAETAAGTEAAGEPAADKNYGEAQLVSVMQDAGTSFFEQARLSRNKARDEALESLQKSLKNAKLSDEEKKSLTDSLSRQIDAITDAADLETLIKAKGFADCLVDLAGEAATVTVMTEGDPLNAEQVTRIRDAVLGKCPELSARQITIVEVK